MRNSILFLRPDQKRPQNVLEIFCCFVLFLLLKTKSSEGTCVNQYPPGSDPGANYTAPNYRFPYPGERVPISILCTVIPAEDFESEFTVSLSRLLNPDQHEKGHNSYPYSANPTSEPGYNLGSTFGSWWDWMTMSCADRLSKALAKEEARQRQQAIQLHQAAPKWVTTLRIGCSPLSESESGSAPGPDCQIPGITNTFGSDVAPKSSIFIRNRWANWMGLKELKLSGSRIAQLVPGAFIGLESLRELDLSGNRLSRIDPGYLSGLSSLQTLDLTGNEINLIDDDAFWPDLNLTLTLTSISLAYNSLQSFPIALLKLQSLQYIDLDHNNLEKLELQRDPVRQMTPLTQVTQLSLNGNQINEIHPAFFKVFPDLERLNLCGNRLISFFPDIFRDTKLAEIDLSFNQLTIEEVAHNFQNLVHLQNLTLDRNYLEGDLNLAGLIPQNLTFLSLDRNNLTGLFLECDLKPGFARTSYNLHNPNCSAQFNLSILSVQFNRLVELSPNSLPDNLEKLEVQGNLISVIHPWTFFHMKRLTLVNLEDNRLTTLTPQMVAIPPSPSLAIPLTEHSRNLSMSKIKIEIDITAVLHSPDKWPAFKEHLFRNLQGEVFSRPFFSIKGNPIVCDQRLEWLAKALEKREQQFKNDPNNQFDQFEPLSSPDPQLFDIPELEIQDFGRDEEDLDLTCMLGGRFKIKIRNLNVLHKAALYHV